jgi:hypothetical protein
MKTWALTIGLLGAFTGSLLAEPPAAEAPATAPRERRSLPAKGEQAVAVEQLANETWQALPLREKVQLLRMQRALREMDPKDRDFIRERIDRHLRMTPKEREQFTQNRKRWQELSPEAKERARQEYRRRREEFEKRWREEHPGEEPPPYAPHRRRGESDGPPPPSEAPDNPPPATDQTPD